MRASFAIALLLFASLFAGCGREDAATPVACLEGPRTFLEALANAPAKVTLDDETPISACLTENQQGGDLATVGSALVEAATELNAAARVEPGGDANLRLGYLVGAAQRGADGTEGIHADLLRRLVVAARYAPGRVPLPATFLATYRRGLDAGHARG